MMRKFIIFATLLLTSNSFAEQLHNYDQIKSVVTEGKLIRMLVDYTKCTPLSTSLSFSKKIVGNDAAVFTPNAMAITNDGDIASYILYFTMNDGHYPSRPVYQYGTYLISKNNTLILTFTSLNAVDYSPLGSSVSINCKIDDGVKVFLAQQNIFMKKYRD